MKTYKIKVEDFTKTAKSGNHFKTVSVDALTKEDADIKAIQTVSILNNTPKQELAIAM